MKSDKPALLGGEPAFEALVPIVRPTLPDLDSELQANVVEILQSGMLTKGKWLRTFEQELVHYLGVKHAVAVSSCTAGLMLTYHALGLSGEVIVPSFTFMATVHPLLWVGAQPVFVDIDPHTWNIDPRKIEEAITDRTTAIVAVHNFGNPAAVAGIEAVARRHQLHLIFDAAHGFGARYRGEPVGRFGDAEVFSTSPTKLLVTGEGGVVATNNDEIADHIRVGREYGNPGDYGSDFPGLNARMPEFNALLGLRSLEMLEENAKQRDAVAKAFIERLELMPGITFQFVHTEDRSSFKDLSLVVDEGAFGLSRDEVALSLKAENVDSRKYHDPPVHTHKAYRHLSPGRREALPITTKVASRSLSLPIWSHMDESIVERISQAIVGIHDHRNELREVMWSQFTLDSSVKKGGTSQ